MLAVAVEKYDLDEYFAFLILSRVDRGAKTVVLAVMFATGFLSMWISNSASTALLIAMALKITDQIKDEKGNFSKIMVLAIAYSATAGGLSTLVGTTTCAMAAARAQNGLPFSSSGAGSAWVKPLRSRALSMSSVMCLWT
jgi:sodium-dependent dicarboxylate transporter 2/3/5